MLIERDAVVVVTGSPERSRVVLSHIDSVLSLMPTGVMHYFSSSVNMDFEKLQRSLEATLQHYPVLTGKLLQEPSGRLIVDCNNQGLHLIKATADGPMSDFNFMDPLHTIPDQLTSNIDPSHYESELLCKFQVTYFTDGGVSIGFSAFHCLLDGCAHFQFFNNWGAVHRGLELMHFPIHDRSLLTSNNDPPAFEHKEFLIMNSPAVSKNQENDNPSPKLTPSPSPNTSELFHFSKESLERLKKDCSNDAKEGWVSTNDALSALFWQRITMLRNPEKSQISKFGLPVNVRSRTNPPLPPTYFGNALCFASAAVKVEDVLESSLNDLASEVRKAVNAMTAERIRSCVNFVNSLEDSSKLFPAFIGPCDFFLTSWNKFSMYATEFGSGKAAFVGPPAVAFSGLGMVLDTPDENGDIFVHLGMPTNLMDALKQDPTFTSYLN